MKQIFQKFKTVFLFSGVVLFIATSFNACSSTTKEASGDTGSIDSTSMTKAVSDSLPPIDTTAKSRPDGTNN